MRNKKLVPRRRIIDIGEIEKEKERENLICFECKRSWHIISECPKLRKELKKKKKAFVAIWSNCEESSFEDEHQECTNLCLMAHEDEIHSDSKFDPSILELY